MAGSGNQSNGAADDGGDPLEQTVTGKAAGSPPVVQQFNRDDDLEQKVTGGGRDQRATAFSSGILDFPGFRQIGGAADVGLSYLSDLGIGPPGQPTLTGSPVQRYRQVQDILDQRTEQANAQRPGWNVAGNLANPANLLIPGAPRVISPVVKTATENAPSAVRIGSRLLSRGAETGGYGAALGATGAYEAGGDPVKGALWGGGLGLAAEPLAIGAGRGQSALPYSPLTDVEYEAQRRTAQALQPDIKSGTGAMTQAEFNDAVARGQPVVMGDLGGEKTHDLARAVANKSSEASATLKGVTGDRFTTQANRFSDFMDGLFPGQDLNTAHLRDEVRTKGRASNDPLYTAAFNDPKAGAVWSPKLASLMRSPDVQDAVGQAQGKAANFAAQDPNIQLPQNPFVKDPNTGMWSRRVDANGNVATPSLQWWDYVKRGLDSKISVARRAGDNDAVRELSSLNNALKDELDGQVPTYAKARASAARFFGEESAIDGAIKFDKVTDEPTLNKMMDQLRTLSPGDRETFARAYAAQLKQRALNPSETRNVVNLFNNQTTAGKIAIGLGSPQRAAQMEAWLRTESSMNQLRAALGNSTTTRQMGKAELAEPGGEGSGGHGGGIQGFLKTALGDVGGAGLTAAIGAHEMGWHGAVPAAFIGGAFSHLLQKASAGINQKVVAKVAENLASNDPDKINQAVNFVAKTPALQEALRRTEGMISYWGGQKMSQVGQ